MCSYHLVINSAVSHQECIYLSPHITVHGQILCVSSPSDLAAGNTRFKIILLIEQGCHLVLGKYILGKNRVGAPRHVLYTVAMWRSEFIVVSEPVGHSHATHELLHWQINGLLTALPHMAPSQCAKTLKMS